MRFISGAIVGMLGCLWMSGCAAGPELKVEMAPVGATPVREFHFAPDGDAALNALVGAALLNEGGREASQGWMLETALASRSAKIGAFSDHPARGGQWSETPRIAGARRGKTLHVLSVALSHAESSERRIVQVSARSNQAEASPVILAILADAAAVALFEGRTSGLSD